jgi:Flp pilus assembly protein TadG
MNVNQVLGGVVKMMRSIRFLYDDRGGGTIMGLLWFMLIVGITGMAVDVTDGFRNRTMLQATADASALAAVIDLPEDAALAVATAVTYAVNNMGSETNGNVLDPEDVTVGLWDPVTKSLDPGSAFPDAVMVTVNRSADNANAVPVNFLRIIGLETWNVTAQAVAQRFIPDCLRDGLIAREIVDMSSNNGFVNEICIHGEQGVNIQSNNFFETGVNVSMPSLDMLEIPASGMTSNIGLPVALRENHLDPRMVNHIDEIIQGVLDKDPAVTPAYIDLTKDVIVTNNQFNFANAIPHRIYHVQCQPMRNLVMPAGVLIDKIALIADCQITIGANSMVIDSFIASRSGPTPGGNENLNRGDANISAAAGAQLGMPDNCAVGGGVQLFSNATMTFASTTSFDGVQMVALGDIALGARDMGINGISAQSGGNITLTSNNMFGLCSGGAPDLFTVDYYRLVL